MFRLTFVALLGLLAAPAGSPLSAQTAAERLRDPGTRGLLTPTAEPPVGKAAGWRAPSAPTGRDPARMALYSLALPGAGQLAQRQRRWLAYGAVEAVAWVLHFERRGSGRGLREEYRTLAWEVARGLRGPRVVDDFEYYERLSSWPASGAWDRDPGQDGIQPETDPATYNGAIWERAREIFFGADAGVGPGDPRWTLALSYYEERAYPPELLWSWNGAAGARDRFGELVRESDDHLREATMMIGVILVNHVISAADALVSARLRETTNGRVESRLEVLPWGVGGGRSARPAGTLSLTLGVRP